MVCRVELVFLYYVHIPRGREIQYQTGVCLRMAEWNPIDATPPTICMCVCGRRVMVRHGLDVVLPKLREGAQKPRNMLGRARRWSKRRHVLRGR